ncbi:MULTISPECIES: DUF6587 family protein [unclassified Luteimonas]|uniref:DUF6587 family protein n=1 Tax=unclassified Luteimonas TaxID=2629088 RepID=UPI0018F09C1E|nr:MULTISPECIES: DUF6587 family protein [unclassified Luteimonas]MBJ6979467.1 hypothetical protein [Luteimonas sp. MC1895]MBJ6984318.1 hypothetical protein [Luteimonas sp. MC1750]QQO05059.1 hypothetical protein JGR68_09235 [Luteimonas sp. MC1750]
MEAGLALQYVVVAAVVALSAWMVLRRQFPLAARRLRVAVAIPMVRDGRPAWLRALGRRIAPPTPAGAKACGSCSGCS